MKECSCVNLFSENIFSLATCKMIFQFGHEKFRLGPAHLGGVFYRHASLCLHQICDYIVRNAIKIMAQNLNFVEPKIIVPTGLYTVGAWLDGECKANSFTVQRINTYMLAFASYFSSSLQSSQFDWLQRHEFRNFVAISESVIFNSVYIDLGRAAQSTLTRTL